MSSEGRLTVLLGDWRCNVLVQVFEVGRKLPLLDTNLVCGEMESRTSWYKWTWSGRTSHITFDYLLPQYEWSSLAEKFDWFLLWHYWLSRVSEVEQIYPSPNIHNTVFKDATTKMARRNRAGRYSSQSPSIASPQGIVGQKINSRYREK